MDVSLRTARLGQMASVLAVVLFASAAMMGGTAQASPSVASPVSTAEGDVAPELAAATETGQVGVAAFGETEADAEEGNGGGGTGGAFGFVAAGVGALTVAILRTFVIRRRKADQARRQE